MTLRITVNLAYVRPVTSDNLWHQVQLSRIPQTGEDLTTLCGRVEQVEFDAYDGNASTLTCWECDAVYRRNHGIPAQSTP